AGRAEGGGGAGTHGDSGGPAIPAGTGRWSVVGPGHPRGPRSPGAPGQGGSNAQEGGPMSVLVVLLTLPLMAAPAPREPALQLKEVATFKGHTFDCVAVRPDGQLLASGVLAGRGGALKLWEVRTGKEIGSFPDYTERLSALAFSADGKLLASGENSRKVTVWD